MFRINNEDTRTTPISSFWYFYCQFWTYFTPCSSGSIVNFEHEIAGCVNPKNVSLGEGDALSGKNVPSSWFFDNL